MKILKKIKLFKIIDEYEKGNLSGEELKNIYKTIKIFHTFIINNVRIKCSINLHN